MSGPQTLGVDPLIALALVVAFTLLAALAWRALVRRRHRVRQRAVHPLAAGDAGAVQPRKIVIFYSSIGHGHISAAQAIEQEIGRLAPDAHVVLQDIREFMHPLWRWVDERLYWFIAGNLPESFDALFHALQARGKRVPSLAWLSSDYPEDKVRSFLETQAPDTVLATHYGSAQVLGTLRERGLLAQVNIGWLHTDFFEGYFPRISKRIDRTFLAHPELESRWLAAGVPPDKVTTSGMPVRAPAADGATRETALTALGLAPDAPTVLITSGKEGIGDYALVVESLARHHSGPLQIIAVCGANTRQQALLTALQKRLPEPVALKVCGLVPHADLLTWMHAADLLITKAGGMTPAEAFAAGTPTILLDVVSGHERENAALFVRLGVADLADTLAQAGELAAAVLASPQRQAAMRRAQLAFHDRAGLGRIARFALDPALPTPGLPVDFGAEHGSAVTDIDAALARLQAEVPCDIELLLSYSTAKTPQRVVLENPFGHIAIRVDDTVYSANYVAVPGHDPNLLQHVTLANYLYGVQPPSPSQVHTNTYGMAYGRETLGLRVAGVAGERKAAMVAEAHRIEDEFRQGRLLWDRSEFNCADVVVRILRAGGYDRSPPLGRRWLPVMPLDIFEEARQACEDDAYLYMELVAYRQIPGANAAYRFSRFPLSLGQPLRSVARALREAPREPLEAAATKQLTGYFGDHQLYFEDLRGHGGDALADDPAHFSRVQRSLAGALATDLRRLLAAQARRPLQEIGRLGELDGAQDIRRLLERSLALARIATERADEVLQDRGARRMRVLFTELVDEYGRIDAWRLRRQEIEAYLKRFQVFEAAVGREFPARHGARPARATTLRRSLRYGIRRLRRRVGGRHRPAGARQGKKPMNEPQTKQAPAAADLTPPRRPRIGLALGSGSARGLAHIGVLRALKEAGITVDVVAGTSMGAVIGAVFASGKLDGLSARLCNLDWPGIVALLDPVFPRSGLIDGQRVAEFVRAHVPSAHIEDLLLPFAAVATYLMTGEAVVATAGDLTEAVRASIAVPGIVTPVRSNGRILVDGGLVNPVPVSVARAMGADLVIAVDLNHDIVSGRLSHPLARANGHGPIMARLLASLQATNSPVLAQFEAWLHKAPLEPLPGIFDVLLASLYIMQARVTEVALQQDRPEILIQPPLGAVRFMEFDRAEEIIDIGYRSAAEQLAHWTRTKTHE